MNWMTLSSSNRTN